MFSAFFLLRKPKRYCGGSSKQLAILTTPTDSICGQTDEEIAKLDEVERPTVREGKLRHCILRLTDLRGKAAKGRERVCQTHHSGLAGSCLVDRAPSVDV
ncbi:hypothetical protein [Bradyrhizobium sp. CB1015]|uniref:hypothetical protein n=1 Tax=Bradyrhizobium sp. CB1015 TaxID=2976822 RepID=UPI0021AA2571|nr:hypothetical protein [Bradyrhizobium sp. CB1015]UWU94311.1 hypothetical protein N2604_10905 [Bradyrhizobium sp. CB1015]